MPWTTPESFTAGQTLTAASMNIISGDIRMGGPVFTNEAARDAAITSPEEGMTAYLTAPTVPAATGATTAVPTGVVTIYNGSVWVCTSPVGAGSTTSASTTSTSYVTTLTSDSTAVSVSLVTGTTALLNLSAIMSVNAAATALMSVAVSGATTLAAADANAVYLTISSQTLSLSIGYVLTGLTAGTNTFTLSYKTSAGTEFFTRRNLTVQGIA